MLVNQAYDGKVITDIPLDDNSTRSLGNNLGCDAYAVKPRGKFIPCVAAFCYELIA